MLTQAYFRMLYIRHYNRHYNSTLNYMHHHGNKSTFPY